LSFIVDILAFFAWFGLLFIKLGVFYIFWSPWSQVELMVGSTEKVFLIEASLPSLVLTTRVRYHKSTWGQITGGALCFKIFTSNNMTLLI